MKTLSKSEQSQKATINRRQPANLWQPLNCVATLAVNQPANQPTKPTSH